MRLSRFATIKYLVLIVIASATLKLLGVFSLLFEKDFSQDFNYPYAGDITEAVYQLKIGETPVLKPINNYNYEYITNISGKCKSNTEEIRIVYLVKSAPENFNRRSAIRSTWGFEKRFSDVEIRTVFLLGYRNVPTLQKFITEEALKHGDIIQANFTDAYFNNTIKTMMGMKWAVTNCFNAKFYMFVDDDYYVSTKNVLRFLRHPTNYPQYLQRTIDSMKKAVIKKRQVMDLELPADVQLYAGFVFHSKPHRHYFSKWYISLEEYPYDMWPPYVTAGAFILSKSSLEDIYYTSYYTKHFRFDDIYIGMLALRAKIEPFHSDQFYFYKKDYTKDDYAFTVAAHGFDDPIDTITAWNEQKSLGNA